jgi:peptidoglycan/LPS O-acetylase OafA/YrhL
MPWHLDRGRAAGEMGYQPGLDGIRALAIVGVLFYHADLEWFPGGFLGVDVFFVLSGFLITTLIIEEYERTGTINFRRFYIRRAQRLLPALFFMLLAFGAIVAAFYRDAARAFGTDAISALFYVTNWWYIVADQSYFEFIGRPALLKHLWSLAVEEQFYLVWPAIAFMLMRWGKRRLVRRVAVILAVASTAWMAILAINNGYPLFADPSRAYFGTDAHAMGLLVGAALATLWRPGRLPTSIPLTSMRLLTGIGIAAIAGIVAFYGFVGWYTPWLYRGGFLLLALVVALAIALVTHPALPLGRWIGQQPMRYLGQRSYGIYLWHWPIFMITRPTLDVPLDGPLLFAVRIGLTLAVAEFSYRIIEMPIRRGLLQRWWSQAGPRVMMPAIVFIVALAVAIGMALFSAPRPSLAEGLPADVAAAIGVDTGGPLEVLIDQESDSPTPEIQGDVADPILDEASLEPAINPNGPLSALGDSVLLGARNAITGSVPGARVDAEVSRMPGAFIGRIKKLRARDKLADVVVLHPATNGVLPESMMREMLDLLEDTPQVIVVNSNMPRTWRKPNNSVIRKVVQDYPNATLVDWFGISKDKPEYFTSDGIHLTPSGAQAFATAISQAAQLAD